MNFRSATCLCVALLVVDVTQAQSFFLPAHDVRLRDDLSLLVDEGVINLPVNEWPLARADVEQAISKINGSDLFEPALRSALSRIAAATKVPENASDWRIREVRMTMGEPGLLRDESTLGRENFELTSMGGAGTERYSITLVATGVIDASDRQELRLDGSEATVRWGNWLFSANQMDRWWGPGRDGSLILSTNARPMPALSLDRYRSLPVDLPVLRWFGPWRFSGFLGLMENERPDVDRPVFMGMRVSFKPAPIFEFGMSRTAQFCGKGRPCDLKTFGRVLIGQDNKGIRGLGNPADEPGNQMAGFDVRIVSPFNALPLALHAQMIGEDNSSTGIPERYLAQFGAESWFTLDSGSVLRTHVEYANNSCKWYNPSLEPHCAYRQAIFFAGYRYHDRNIGHTTDANSETTSIALTLTQADGDRLALRIRHGRLYAYGVPDPYNPVSQGRSDYESAELGWEGRVRGQSLGMQLGYERQRPASAGDAKGVFGFIQWRKPL
ncbi:MAG: capsule assembly Wzi family protein [Steroidobacteraceae bacterium]